ncbi:hypothetical protein POTOM_027654 [Populus tomentosa]|uniref:Uncharacterized protein n=1 Tax=Populus tomentosa TaxID=118781 RepID=A0A8X8CW75_POPTO|nr:hypothetical protein POTOM_027654 [Populus tomentosa]
MNEHGVKESRIKMLVTESNKIDPEKPQYVFFSLVAKEGFEPSCSLENCSVSWLGPPQDAMKLTLMEVLQEILVVRSIAYESGNADFDLWYLLGIIRLVLGFKASQSP